VTAVASSARPARAVRRATSEEDKTRRREEILAAAKRVFAARGFHATTMADVAKAARLSYGSIYWYFPSKEALFHALMEAEEAALRARIAAALAEGLPSSPEEAFRRAVRATFEFFEADRAAVKLLFRDAYALGDRFEKHLFGIYERFIDEIEEAIAQAQAEGLIVEAPPRLVAFSVAALVGQLALRRLGTDDGVSAAVVADFVVALVLDGLRRPAPGRGRRAAARDAVAAGVRR
jgi:AcrR family transcriptional regulator